VTHVRTESTGELCEPVGHAGGALDLLSLFEPARFTRFCAVAALGWLLLVIGGSMLLWPKVEDFGQYYMGGALAHAGLHDSLYPIPIPDAGLNAGWGNASVLPPAYAAMAEARSVGDPSRPIDVSVRYIQSPAAALLLAWMGPLSHDAAFRVWIVLMILCTWGTAVYAGRFFDLLAARRTHTAGLMILIVACSPLAFRTVRSSNVTPVVAFTGAVVVWNLLRPATRASSLRSAIAMVIGGLAKYTPVSLFLPALLMRRWALFGWTALLGFGFCGVSLLVMGREPWEQFMFSILPTLGYGSHYVGNQSLAGMIQRTTGAETLDPALMRVVRIVGLAVLAALAGLMVRSREWLTSPPVLMAAAAGVTAWWAVSGPLYWEHYYLALAPFWPWLIWEAKCGGGRIAWRTPAAISAMALTWFPVIMLLRHGFELREPFGSHMFFGAALILILAMARLRSPDPKRA
jgi:hypothetical protein